MIDYVKIMPEVLANPIWDKNGVMMSWSEFNCPDDHLVNRLVIWNYESECSTVTLYNRGLALAKNVKHYYPNTQVMYYYDENHPMIEIEIGEPLWIAVKELNNES